MSQDAERARSDEYATFRAYREDAKLLAELAELEGKTAAEAFRDQCRESLRRALVAVAERRLRQLKAEGK